MAFVNEDGLQVSFFCDDLIAELKEDIDEFGGHMLVDVITQQSHGATLYKDYFPSVTSAPDLLDHSYSLREFAPTNDEIRRLYFSVPEKNCQKSVKNSARFRYGFLAVFRE